METFFSWSLSCDLNGLSRLYKETLDKNPYIRAVRDGVSAAE